MPDEPNSPGPVEWAVSSRPLPGQSALGDGSVIKPVPGGLLIAVVDGLGHGSEAAKAAEVGLIAIGNHPDSSLLSIVHLCNEALSQTRGLVMGIALIDYAAEQMSWLGIGNVDGVLVRANPQSQPATHSILQRGGVLGFQLPALQTDILPLNRGDLLIFNTDGIRPGFVPTILKSEGCAQIAERILNNFFKGTDDALVLVARYLGRAS